MKKLSKSLFADGAYKLRNWVRGVATAGVLLFNAFASRGGYDPLTGIEAAAVLGVVSGVLALGQGVTDANGNLGGDNNPPPV